MLNKPIKFSEHSKIIIDILGKHDVSINEKLVEEILRAPSKIEMGYKNRKIAQGGLDYRHVLRIVYEENVNEILVITLYPGRKTRYEKN